MRRRVKPEKVSFPLQEDLFFYENNSFSSMRERDVGTASAALWEEPLLFGGWPEVFLLDTLDIPREIIRLLCGGTSAYHQDLQLFCERIFYFPVIFYLLFFEKIYFRRTSSSSSDWKGFPSSSAKKLWWSFLWSSSMDRASFFYRKGFCSSSTGTAHVFFLYEESYCSFKGKASSTGRPTALKLVKVLF